MRIRTARRHRRANAAFAPARGGALLAGARSRRAGSEAPWHCAHCEVPRESSRARHCAGREGGWRRSFSDAFANLAKKAKPQKPGEGAPKRTDVKGLPIRLGGNVRDGSLGSFRAAGKNLDVLKDPRNWETEEFGLLGVIVFTVAAFSYGYIEYVADKPDIAPAPGQAAIVRQQKVAACAGDTKCIQAAVDSTQEAMEKEGALKGCLNYAFGRTEKQMCEDKYGAKGGFKLF